VITFSGNVADVVIIGAGVVGTAIARTLASYSLDCVLVDAARDVGTGTSKANTAILHTGFDAKLGSLEARLVARGSSLLREYADAAGIPVERTGALLVAWTAEQLAALPSIASNARRNGYMAVQPISASALYAREPRLGPGALGALEIPDESIICPWTTPLAFATEAVNAGVRLALDTRVTGVTGVGSAGSAHELTTSRGALRSRWVVNAAGLGSDVVDGMFGGDGFAIRPRRGELIVFDKLARSLLRSIILPVPTARTKGVLVAPTVYGNILLGPTASDLTDREDVSTTADGLRSLLTAGHRILPGLAGEEVTATYAGLRAATEHPDYQIYVDAGLRYACAGGIRSTGLSASLGIAEYVVSEMASAGLALKPRPGGGPVPVPVMPYIGEAGVRPYQVAEAPQYGEIVCHCERVTRGEIADALVSVVPPADLGGLRRRTRAMNGRCQGFYCAATLYNQGGRPPFQPPASGGSAPPRPPREVDVLVVGAGPAGLSAAAELRRLGVGSVLVCDRETELGGIPRHSMHTGYGRRDLRRIMTGPAYARRLVSLAEAAGAELRAGTTVTDLDAAALTATMTSAAGRETVRARAVLLATGCRERPRAARLVPGDRPAGVMTTGELQQRVYLNGERLPGPAVVVGAEHVSFSAAVTLAHAGARVVALVTEYPHQQSYAAFRLGAAVRWRIPVWTSASVHRVTGRGRLDGVEIKDLVSGAVRFVPCRTLVFTGDWIPDHELARASGLDMDPGTLGPAVDTALRTAAADVSLAGVTGAGVTGAGVTGAGVTGAGVFAAGVTGAGVTAAGVFAAGNLVHAVETADVAALSGRHAGRQIVSALASPDAANVVLPRDGTPATPATRVALVTRATHAAVAARLPVVVEPPLRWISPNAIDALGTPPPLGRFTLRSSEFRSLVRLEVRQDARPEGDLDGGLNGRQGGRRLALSRPIRLIPGRPVHLRADWLARVDPSGGPVSVRIHNRLANDMAVTSMSLRAGPGVIYPFAAGRAQVSSQRYQRLRLRIVVRIGQDMPISSNWSTNYGGNLVLHGILVYEYGA